MKKADTGKTHPTFLRSRIVSMTLVQYVVVRGDLLRKLGWPVGAVIAQACHACTAATHAFRDDDKQRR